MKIDSNNLELSYERLQVETHLCGGVLINRNYALVGAHCLRFNYDQRLGVGYGSGDLLAIYDKGRIPISKGMKWYLILFKFLILVLIVSNL